MPIAMMFFLLCLTIGIIVLTAASASYSRLSVIQKEEQDYLTVSSAAVLLKNKLAGSWYREVKVNGILSDDSPKSTFSVLQTKLENLCNGGNDTISIKIEAAFLPKDSSTVNGTLSMDGHKNITINLWIGEADTPGKNPVTVQLGAVSTTSVERKKNTEKITDSVTGDVIGEEISITETITTTYRWPSSQAKIIKGIVPDTKNNGGSNTSSEEESTSE